jgi:SSS family solute:Na+ symporter
MQIWGLHVVDLALVLVYVLVVLWLGKRAARRMTNLDEFFRR